MEHFINFNIISILTVIINRMIISMTENNEGQDISSRKRNYNVID